MKKTAIVFRMFAVVGCAAVWCPDSVLAQPSLLPPGPPTAPSGRMGVRTEIRSLPYTITAPGSYYLASTLFQTIAGSPGIIIDASEVTIDLMGFALIGLGSPGDDGIAFGPGGPYRDVTIHSGFIAFWGGDGLDSITSGFGPIPGMHVWELTAYENDGEGIRIGPGSIVRHVISSNNTLAGIYVDRKCKVTNAVATLNGGPGMITGPYCHVSDSVGSANASDGIVLGPQNVLIGSTFDNNGSNGVILSLSSRVTDCTASENGFGFGFGSGFFAGGDGNVLGGCAAYNNFNSGFDSIVAPPFGGSSVHDCFASFNGFGSGIGDGFTNFRTVSGCTANGNSDNGIEVMANGHVFKNTCEGNGANGIEALADGNAIEENHVVGNVLVGITTIANPGPGGNLATRNRAHINGAGAYAFAGALDTTGMVIVGPVVLGMVAGHMANVAY
jgi:hypothetical protein